MMGERLFRLGRKFLICTALPRLIDVNVGSGNRVSDRERFESRAFWR